MQPPHTFTRLAVFVFVIACTAVLAPRRDTAFTPTNIAPTYMEFAFDSGDDVDLGFTKRAYARLQEAEKLLSEDTAPLDDNHMAYVRVLPRGALSKLEERRMWGEDTYELHRTTFALINDRYRMLKNGMLLFEARMAFGASGPVQDWRIVNGKPAFTFSTSCTADEHRRVTCGQDIWYDGVFFSERYGVTNPRYLFVHDGVIGFIAEHEGKDSIYFDGQFITPGFDRIWTHNCCSYTEILPTVFTNGALLFYARRDGVTYLVETRLLGQQR